MSNSGLTKADTLSVPILYNSSYLNVTVCTEESVEVEVCKQTPVYITGVCQDKSITVARSITAVRSMTIASARCCYRCCGTITRNQQEEQDEDNQKHNRPVRVMSKCSHEFSPPLFSVNLNYV